MTHPEWDADYFPWCGLVGGVTAILPVMRLLSEKRLDGSRSCLGRRLLRAKKHCVGPGPGRGVGQNFANWTTQERLTGSRSCLCRRLLGTQGLLYEMGFPISPRRGKGGFDTAFAKLLWPLVKSLFCVNFSYDIVYDRLSYHQFCTKYVRIIYRVSYRCWHQALKPRRSRHRLAAKPL